ncbi:MAG: hypothetical protein QMC67_04085 [Candidatus Wallbacteria bacterium]
MKKKFNCNGSSFFSGKFLICSVICLLVLACSGIALRNNLYAADETKLDEQLSEFIKDDSLTSGKLGTMDFPGNPSSYTYPEVSNYMKITNSEQSGNVFNVLQGQECEFQFNSSSYINQMETDVFKKSIGAGNYSNIALHSVHYTILNWDKTMLTLTPPNGGSNIKYTFNYATDPNESCRVGVTAIFTYDAGGKPHWFFVQKILGQVLTVDNIPPHEIYFDTPVLLATTNDKISNFNKKAKAWNFKADENPDIIRVAVKDNNYFASAKKNGVLHKYNQKGSPNIAFYVEVFKTYYGKLPDASSSQNKIERITGERVDENALNTSKGKATPDGAFEWVGPIWADDMPNWKYQIVSAEVNNGQVVADGHPTNSPVADKSKLCSVIVFEGPITDLENAMEKLRPGSSIMNPHYASRSGIAFTDNAVKESHSIQSSSGVTECCTRIIVSACDTSMNFRLPYLAAGSNVFINDIKTRYGTTPNYMAAGQMECMAIVPYDDISPNPMLSMTNTETNKTTIFTLPNSDLCSAPYSPYNKDLGDLWHFKYDNSTETMKWLEANDPDRYKEYTEALQINEDVRLIFDMAAYDNINRNVEVKNQGNKIGQYGISTPMDGFEKNDDSLLRYCTWIIQDPTGVDNLKYENKDNNVFTYPDYIFRNPDASKTYNVAFFVDDFSPFYNPNRPSTGASKSPGNRRAIVLEFKLSNKKVESRSMGGSNTVKTQNKNNN